MQCAGSVLSPTLGSPAIFSNIAILGGCQVLPVYLSAQSGIMLPHQQLHGVLEAFRCKSNLGEDCHSVNEWKQKSRLIRRQRSATFALRQHFQATSASML